MRGLLMPHYGSQYVGMCKELYDEFRVVQEYFEEASDCLNINFVKLAFASSDADISSAEQGALALFVVESASAALLRSQGVPYSIVSGLDRVSWYSSLHAAGVLSLPDGLYLLNKWIEFTIPFMQQEQTSLMIYSPTIEIVSMVTVLCEQSTAREAFVRIGMIDEESMQVVGSSEGISYVEEQLQQQQLTVERHTVQSLFTIPFTQEMYDNFVQYFEKIDFKDSSIPVIHPLQAGSARTADEFRLCARDMLIKPLRRDVMIQEIRQWKEGIIAVPALHIKESINARLSSVRWYTMETKAESTELFEQVKTLQESS